MSERPGKDQNIFKIITENRLRKSKDILQGNFKEHLYSPGPSLPALRKIKSRTPEKLCKTGSKSDRTADTSTVNLKSYMPDWLTSRDDFSIFLNEMSQKSKNIDQICLQHHSVRSTEEKEFLFKWVYSIQFFTKMPRNLVYETCDYLITRVFREGESIIKKGQEADCMFIIFSGVAGIYINGVKISQRSSSDVVGEIALENDRPRNADVISETAVIALQLKKIYYIAKILHFKIQEKSENIKFLLSLPMFSNWSHPRISHFATFLITSSFCQDQIIYEENSDSQNLFFIQSGSVILQKAIQVTKENKWPIGLRKWNTKKIQSTGLYTLQQLGPGEVFGLEVFTSEARICRAASLAGSVCLVLNRPDCLDLFRPAEQISLKEMQAKIPDKELMQKWVARGLDQKIRKIKIMHDALEINYKDWGGRESEIEKKLKRKTRCLTSLKVNN